MDLNKKKILRKHFLLFACSAVLLVVALLCYSLGWFSFNTDSQADGVGMRAIGKNFEIIMLDDGENGKWYDPYHIKIREVTGSSALIWQMTDDYNMGNNATASEGIKPGSSGKVSFFVSPKIDTVTLNFNFEIVGYRNVDEDENDEDTGDEDENNEDKDIGIMEALTSSSTKAIDRDVANYLNGHILLFEECTPVTEIVKDETTGKEEQVETGEYIYSGFIASDADMKRVLKNKKFKKSDGDKQQVTIYWVWPETLSTLVNATDCTVMEITQNPFTNTSDGTYQAILTNIQTYPQYYLKSVNKVITTDVEGNKTVSYTTKGETITSLSPNEIATKYDVYGDLYDQVDNDIGMNANYIVLKMSVEEIADSN